MAQTQAVEYESPGASRRPLRNAGRRALAADAAVGPDRPGSLRPSLLSGCPSPTGPGAMPLLRHLQGGCLSIATPPTTVGTPPTAEAEDRQAHVQARDVAAGVVALIPESGDADSPEQGDRKRANDRQAPDLDAPVPPTVPWIVPASGVHRHPLSRRVAGSCSTTGIGTCACSNVGPVPNGTVPTQARSCRVSLRGCAVVRARAWRRRRGVRW